MKTIRELLEQLPEPYRSQAIANSTANELKKVDGSIDSPRVALQTAFIWQDSREGLSYWRDFYLTLIVDPIATIQKPWTPKELEILRKLYPDNSNDSISILIDRSTSAIAHKAHRLKLRKSEEFKNSTQSGRFLVKKESVLRRFFRNLFH